MLVYHSTPNHLMFRIAVLLSCCYLTLAELDRPEFRSYLFRAASSLHQQAVEISPTVTKLAKLAGRFALQTAIKTGLAVTNEAAHLVEDAQLVRPAFSSMGDRIISSLGRAVAFVRNQTSFIIDDLLSLLPGNATSHVSHFLANSISSIHTCANSSMVVIRGRGSEFASKALVAVINATKLVNDTIHNTVAPALVDGVARTRSLYNAIARGVSELVPEDFSFKDSVDFVKFKLSFALRPNLCPFLDDDILHYDPVSAMMRLHFIMPNTSSLLMSLEDHHLGLMRYLITDDVASVFVAHMDPVIARAASWAVCRIRRPYCLYAHYNGNCSNQAQTIRFINCLALAESDFARLACEGIETNPGPPKVDFTPNPLRKHIRARRGKKTVLDPSDYATDHVPVGNPRNSERERMAQFRRDQRAYELAGFRGKGQRIGSKAENLGRDLSHAREIARYHRTFMPSSSSLPGAAPVNVRKHSDDPEIEAVLASMRRPMKKRPVIKFSVRDPLHQAVQKLEQRKDRARNPIHVTDNDIFLALRLGKVKLQKAIEILSQFEFECFTGSGPRLPITVRGKAIVPDFFFIKRIGMRLIRAMKKRSLSGAETLSSLGLVEKNPGPDMSHQIAAMYSLTPELRRKMYADAVEVDGPWACVIPEGFEGPCVVDERHMARCLFCNEIMSNRSRACRGLHVGDRVALPHRRPKIGGMRPLTRAPCAAGPSPPQRTEMVVNLPNVVASPPISSGPSSSSGASSSGDSYMSACGMAHRSVPRAQTARSECPSISTESSSSSGASLSGESHNSSCMERPPVLDGVKPPYHVLAAAFLEKNGMRPLPWLRYISQWLVVRRSYIEHTGPDRRIISNRITKLNDSDFYVDEVRPTPALYALYIILPMARSLLCLGCWCMLLHLLSPRLIRWASLIANAFLLPWRINVVVLHNLCFYLLLSRSCIQLLHHTHHCLSLSRLDLMCYVPHLVSCIMNEFGQRHVNAQTLRLNLHPTAIRTTTINVPDRQHTHYFDSSELVSYHCIVSNFLCDPVRPVDRVQYCIRL